MELRFCEQAFVGQHVAKSEATREQLAQIMLSREQDGPTMDTQLLIGHEEAVDDEPTVGCNRQVNTPNLC